MNPSDTETPNEERTPSRTVLTIRTAELLTAATLAVIALITMWSNNEIGAGWGRYGPEAGYFPMRLGIIVLLASCFVAFQAIRKNDQSAFIELEQARLVAVILLPLLLYVFVLGYLGIYVSSVIFIATFMFFLGKFAWWKSVGLACLIMLVFFYIFEIQFMVPLPKGPVEDFFGF